MQFCRALKHLYHRIPIGWRPPRGARTLRAFYEQSQWWQPDDMRAYQLRRMRDLLRYAGENVPYYEALFRGTGFRPEELDALEGIQRLPLLDKDTVRAQAAALASRECRRWRTATRTTGGSTGRHLDVLMSEKGQHAHLADRIRHYNWAGYELGDRAAIFWMFLDPRDAEMPWHYHRPRNLLYINANLFTPETLRGMAAKLAEFQPSVILVSPSHLYWLYQYLAENPETRLRPRTFITSSEMLYGFQREDVERFFGVKVFDYYGMAEHAASAAECPAGSYHVGAEHNYMEVVRPDGSPAAPGEVGEIVGTNLENYAMPLIRYRTGDLGALSDAPCPCGRTLPVLCGISGRTQDMIVTPEGQTVIIYRRFRFHEVPAAREVQVIQEELRRFRVKVVPNPGYTDEDSARIARMVQDAVRFPAAVEVEQVAQIPRTIRGKFRLVECRVPAPLWTGATERASGA